MQAKLRKLRQSLVQDEIHRARIATWGLLAVALLVFVFLGVTIVSGHWDKGPAWSFIALLGLASLFVALPLVTKLSLSKDGGGLDFSSPLAVLDRLESKADAARAESFEQTRQQISGLSQQLEQLATALLPKIEAAEVEDFPARDGEAQPSQEPLLADLLRALPPVTNPNDQQKNRFGAESGNGRRLKASVEDSPLGKKWQRVVLSVYSEIDQPLMGAYAYFFLHETFDPDIYRVKIRPGDRLVSLETTAVGAFTAGAITDRGDTRLEIDLATSLSVTAPQWWRDL